MKHCTYLKEMESIHKKIGAIGLKNTLKLIGK